MLVLLVVVDSPVVSDVELAEIEDPSARVDEMESVVDVVEDVDEAAEVLMERDEVEAEMRKENGCL